MDVVSLHQAGFKETVGVLGTALTMNQVLLISQFEKNVILGFDQDRAGRNAIVRSYEPLNKAGFNVRVLDLPDGKDPDEYIKKHGTDHFEAVINQSKPFVFFMVDNVAKHCMDGEYLNRIKFKEELFPIISSLNNKIDQEEIFDKMAIKIGGSKTKGHLLAEYKLFEENKKTRHEPSYLKGSSNGQSKKRETEVTKKEITLLILLSKFGEVLKKEQLMSVYLDFIDLRKDGFPASVLNKYEMNALSESLLLELSDSFEMKGQPLRNLISKHLISFMDRYDKEMASVDILRLDRDIHLSGLRRR